jgi:transcriptional/translational regulatory protein YebC/TACO1
VRDAVEAAGLPVESSGITMIPDTTITCAGRNAEKIINLVEALEDNDDVQKVHANFDIPDEDLAAL